MEDIFWYIDSQHFDVSDVDGAPISHRQLAIVASDSWKKSFWERNTVEPAMMRVPIVILAFMFLFAANFFIMEKMRIIYQVPLALKAGAYQPLFVSAVVGSLLYMLVFGLLSRVSGYRVEVSIIVFYSLATVLCLLPHLPGQESRSVVFRLARLMLMPGNSISFSEVLVADALTSVSKVLKDLGLSLFVVYCYFSDRNILELHNEAMIAVALCASLPYWIRMRQCWVQFEGASDWLARFPISLNIVKYATGLPPIWLAAAASIGYFHPELPHWTAVFASINSIFSFLWDVVMDWGIFSFARHSGLRPSCRKRVLFPIYTYPVVLVINFCFRFSWVANRIPRLAVLHSSQLIFLVEIAEIIRRSLWNFYRIEWEILVRDEKAANGKDDEAPSPFGSSIGIGSSMSSSSGSAKAIGSNNGGSSINLLAI